MNHVLNKNQLASLIAYSWIVFIVGCSVFAPPPEPTKVLETSTSPALKLIVPRDSNDFKISSPVVLLIENQTDRTYWFPLDYGLEVYYADLNSENWQWLEQDFGVLIRPGDEILLHPPKGLGYVDDLLVPLRLNLLERTTTTRVRIAVTGYLYDNDTLTDKSVNAATEIILEP